MTFPLTREMWDLIKHHGQDLGDRNADEVDITKDVYAIRDGWGWRLIWVRRSPSKKRYETLNDAIEAYGLGKVEWYL